MEQINDEIKIKLSLYRNMIDFYSEKGDKCCFDLKKEFVFYHPSFQYLVGWTTYQTILYQLMLSSVKSQCVF